ncbi:hemerythrin domain-containing protein [uncultured Microscilla sp.]|uniref:hemerythrin domain-containing protein n=1 Tax=uncultured Microscilla sp. TaxID=432653 RepID=UPI002625A9D0|nr:hemerythrin domain-containing protein [uncultured Microscilla sp.]
MDKINTRITDLVSNNPESASVLHFLGIHFFNYTEKTLGEVCQEHDVDAALVIRRLNESALVKDKAQINLEEYPIELIVEYLKHSHYVFIKQRLSYIASLLESYQDSSAVVKDLKLIFPHFFKDFIEHIYEEEDTLFAYILTLNKVKKHAGGKPVSKEIIEKLQQKSQGKTVADYEKEHREEDNEMSGMRELTNQYAQASSEDLHAKVILDALKSFEGELKIHAKIENDILFPKAIQLETEVLAVS